jgi:hypothetical protein
MTPKEKAIELVDKFNLPSGLMSIERKQCALITVSEIRDVIPMISEIQDYWIQVKNEIEKL